MTTELDKRIKWQSRRGLWELDAILVPFSESCLDEIDGNNKEMLLDLLKNEDVDLMDWIVTGINQPEHYTEIIDLLRTKHLEDNE
ncbi:MAG: succinate dehydrogenase assembly factor 2 [Gammaproteobacteria bacterium]